MHPLHDYIAKQLAERLKARLVVWYDVRGDALELVILYLLGCERDREYSVLMELEKTGDCYEPQLKRLARNVSRQRYTDGAIDELLSWERVTYEDLARAADSSGPEPSSILNGIFHTVGSNDVLAAWLASDAQDPEIEAQEAAPELRSLVRARLGLALPEDAVLARLRAIVLRYVLASGFRSDLHCGPHAGLDAVPIPQTKDEEAALRELAQRLRAGFSNDYAALAAPRTRSSSGGCARRFDISCSRRAPRWRCPPEPHAFSDNGDGGIIRRHCVLMRWRDAGVIDCARRRYRGQMR